MTRRPPMYLHIGLPKTGSTHLQALLAAHRPALRHHGYTYPDAGPEAMFHAAVEMASRPEAWGLSDATVAGAFDRVLDAARGDGGTAVVSHEIFSAATRKEVDRIGERIGDRLGEVDLHVVVTVRDLARTVAAQWQERVKNGVDESYAAFAASVLADRPRDTTSTAKGFWHTHHVPWVLTRWERLVAPDRVHVVVTPDRGAGPGALWQRFAEAVGLPPGAVDTASVVETPGTTNESLGAAQVALLRATLAAAGLEQPWAAQVGKRWFAQSALARARSPRPVTPADVAAGLGEVADTWITALGERGYRVHGDLEELRPVAPPPGTPHPDDVDPADVVRDLPEVLAEVLRHERDQRLAIAALKEEVARLTAELDRPSRLPRRRR